MKSIVFIMGKWYILSRMIHKRCLRKSKKIILIKDCGKIILNHKYSREMITMVLFLLYVKSFSV